LIVEELKAQAEALGIKVDGRWSEERLQDEIDKALADPAPAPKANGSTLTNLLANPSKRLGLTGFGSVELTDAQLADDKLMAKIEHGVETGVLSLS
jgi:hypothetical protein